MHKTNFKRGFTLLETLLYIALFGILMSGAVFSAYSLMEGGARNESATTLQEEGTFINRKLSWALTDATAASVSGGGSKLTITRPDLGAQSPLILEFSSGNLTLLRGSGAPVTLNAERFPLENLLFTYQSASGGKPPSVAINFSISGKPFVFKKYLR